MRVPFSSNLDELFRGDRSLVWKVLGAAAVTSFVVLTLVYRGIRTGQLPGSLGPTGYAVIGVVAGLVGGFIALGLAIKDYVDRKRDRGEPVHGLFTVFFGGGIATLGAWVAMVFFLTFVSVMILVQLGIV